ncbi:hypothetical protein G7054_g10481 [Neopestalotiopsis clavispora]|nr:hypothetical protein G7054_g10481 [Neopestalotiopsis clavispora]
MDGETELMPPPAVPYTAYVATIWSFVAISGVTLICRVVSRFQGPRRLYWDDALVVFSWLLSLATATTWQWAAKDMYYIMNVQAGKATYEASRYLVALRVWLSASLIAAVFFYTGLLLVKLSFLVFFRRLGKIIYIFKYIWWPVLIVTLGSYFSAIGNANYKCLGGTIEQITVVCQRKKELDFTANILKANAALDVLTDLLIMLLPTFLVWNTQIRQSKKLALVGLFSLSIITIVIAITRAVMVDSERRPDGNPDVTWLWFWSAVEPSVAIMVCCGSAFPQLFTSSKRSSAKPKFTPSETYLRMMSRLRSPKKQHQLKGDSVLLESTVSSFNGIPELENHSDIMTVSAYQGRKTDVEAGHGSVGPEMSETKERSNLGSEPTLTAVHLAVHSE